MSSSEPIAIVGLGGILPGAATLDDFWNVVEEGVDTASEPPEGRWHLDLDQVYDPERARADHVYSKRACFIRDFELDPAGLDLPTELLDALDPMVHLALHAGRQAWQDAVTDPLDPGRVGVMLGNLVLPTVSASAMADWILGRRFEREVFRAAGVPMPPENREPVGAVNRWVAGLPAAVLARGLRLGGDRFCLDAACSSSLFAVELGVDALREGRLDAVLAGGLSRPDSLYTQMGFSQLLAVSPTGRCSPFDQKSDGLVVGEGAGVLVLKRLSDAVAHGDRIRAVVKSVGLSNDVEGSLLAPSKEGQLRAMQGAYASAGWHPSDVDLVECHATGTPVGDAVEFASLRALWAEDETQNARCVIGSAKSNTGHLLTGAGAVGLLKTVLAMEHATLPPTANFEEAGDKVDLAQSPFRVLQKAEPWEAPTGHARRAAVSGFGFGGTNAHVLLEEALEPVAGRSAVTVPELPQSETAETLAETPTSEGLSSASEGVAIVGMGARVGPWKDLEAVQRRILGRGDDHPAHPKNNHWGVPDPPLGWFIEALEIPFGQFKIPPKEIEEALPQQMLMLQMAKGAITDAGLDEFERLRTGVFVGVEIDLNTTNYHLRWAVRGRAADWAARMDQPTEGPDFEHWVEDLCDSLTPALNANRTIGGLGSIVASRVAREFGLGGPSYVLASEETSGMSALQAAIRSLKTGRLDCALVGAVDLSGDVRSLLSLASSDGLAADGIPHPFGGDSQGVVPSDGAVALVLKREEDAQRDGDRIYAVVRGMGSAGGDLAEASIEAARRSCRVAGIDPETVPFVEGHGGGTPRDDRIEAQALSSVHGSDTLLGCTKGRVGHTGAAAGLISVLGASLALYQQVLPAAERRDVTVPGNGSRDQKAGLVPLADSRPWVCDLEDGPRRAGVLAVSRGGSCSHVVLEESTAETDAAVVPTAAVRTAAMREEERTNPLGPLNEGLFVVEGDDDEAIVTGLRRLAEFVAVARAPEAQGSDSAPGDVDPVRVSDLARLWWTNEPLRPSAGRAIALIARDSTEVETLARAATDRVEAGDDPSDRSAGRVFFTREPLGPEGQLGFVYPGAGSQFAGMGRDLCLQWPDVLRAQDATSEKLSSQLRASEIWRSGPTPPDARTVILSQVALGTLATDLMARFGVRPESVIGYSLGETAGLFSTGAWHERDEMLRRTTENDLFETQLTGPCTAARSAWGLDEDAGVEWSIGVVDRPAEEIRAVLEGRERVYLLIINTPDECVIGGDAEAVSGAVEALGSAFHELQGVTTVHCEVAQEVADAYRDLHLLDTRPPEGVRFYSGAWGESYEVDRERAADSLLAQALHGVDFPKTVRQAYEDGTRIFLEMGPGASCTRMISKILDGLPFRARSISSSTQDEPSSVLRSLAMLLVERVLVDLEALYPGVLEAVERPAGMIRVPIGQAGFGTIPVAVVDELAAGIYDSVSPTHPAPQHTELPPDLAVAVRAAESTLETHQAFLRSAEHTRKLAAAQLAHQQDLLHALARGGPTSLVPDVRLSVPEVTTPVATEAVGISPVPQRSVALDRTQLMEFAIGSIGKVLGDRFAHVDGHPTRVRLPDEPLMLVDRVVSIEAEPQSMTSGRIVTEHDVLEKAWYLDGGLIPTCVAVEAGQADLLLSGYLGIDSETRGLAVYRLLDAVVTFHGELPGPGQVIVYNIQIIRFFRQGDTWLFRFQFDATVDGRPLMTMREGSAGFFSQGALDAGKGIVLSALEQREIAGQRPDDWRDLAPMRRESYDEERVEALRRGDLVGAFGEEFAGLDMTRPLTIPGDRMRLVHRVTELDPEGGRYGIGTIVAEADIHPDDWFLTCHFVDDQVMPGTLMYECCLHTLRIFLLRMGWIAEEGQATWQPVMEVKSRLRCRGQVLASTAMVTYEINVRELGYRPEPYAIVDAMMYADGKPIVDIREMSVRLNGTNREQLEALWARRGAAGSVPHQTPATSLPERGTPSEMTVVDAPSAPPRVVPLERDTSVLYDKASILAFSSGKPSQAFGDVYHSFDSGPRRIARLPRPPYQFMDRVTAVEGEPFIMKAGAKATAEFDVAEDHWYYASNRQEEMPFAVLLEVALQPCGWLAGYVGSALAAKTDVRFRNLGGDAVQLARLTAGPDVITTDVELTSVSMSGGMIIQHYAMSLTSDRLGPLYQGTTYFGFFSEQALADQVGMREAVIYEPSAAERDRGSSFPISPERPLPDADFRMVDHVDLLVPDGGPEGLGWIEGSIEVDPTKWFFEAHFYEDPVWPGSLGLEAFVQLLKTYAMDRWDLAEAIEFETVPGDTPHRWGYRGQIVPGCQRVEVRASITAVDDDQRTLVADGFLSVDGRTIYSMNDFSLGAR